MGSLATHLLKTAIMFAKGCCIHGGMVFFMQSHFTSDPRVRFHPYDFLDHTFDGHLVSIRVLA